MLNKAIRGFSLIELIVVLAILGILVAWAIPHYYTYTQAARRTDAIKSMTRILSQQEIFYANNNATYTNAVGILGFPSYNDNDQKTISEEGHYVIEMEGCASGITECIQLTATPTPGGLQSDDLICTEMIINSRGQKSYRHDSSITPPSNFSCWG